ncbi:MAG: hypothetical protein QNK04_15380 [Myxococcota bacterium]|nr:hypothetical protein [Myxococcota bacterium]
MNALNAKLVERSRLAPRERDAMYGILCRHFRGVERARFEKDLDEKNWVILLEDSETRIQGFSTLLFYETEHEGEPLSVVYSGDTIVDRAAWGGSALFRAWIQAVRTLHRDHGRGRLLWLLIVSGFRTYRLLPVFFREFFPRYDRPAPAATRSLVDRLARERFGSRYDPRAGHVRFEAPQCLAPELAAISEERRRNPHVAFFEQRNPDHARGCELVCLAELSDANLSAAGRRMLAGASS